MDISKSVIENTLRNLKRRHFAAYYAESAEEARDLALSLIPAGDSVAWGGSRTAEQIGLTDALKARTDITLIDRDKADTPEKKRELMRQGLLADSFVAGINAVSEDGWLVNIDGTGNRVAAITFGPENVVLVAGVNKITSSYEEAMLRARNIAAPLNVQRFGLPDPCAKAGKCMDCLADTTICSHFVEHRFCKPAGRIKVIIIGEDLGF